MAETPHDKFTDYFKKLMNFPKDKAYYKAMYELERGERRFYQRLVNKIFRQTLKVQPPEVK